MHEDNLKEVMCMEEILEKDLRTELKKVKDNGSFAPGQTKTILEAIELMLKAKEYEEWLEGKGMSETSQRHYARDYVDHSYAPHRNYYADRPMHHITPYDMGYSGHSTKDRMIARLEDMMGDVKNDYEANMVRGVIDYIQQSGK